MIPVIIPAEKHAPADGIAYADAPNTSEYAYAEDEVLSEDTPVRVVPSEALQALLRLKGFNRYERQFGQRVSESIRARLLGMWKLVEAIRSGNLAKEEEYLCFMLAAHRADRKQSKAKRSDLDAMIRIFRKRDQSELDKLGPVGVLRRKLPRPPLVLWANKQAGTLVPGIFAGSFSDSLFAHLFLSLQSPEGWATCVNCGRQ